MANSLKAGDPAPDFSGITTDGKKVVRFVDFYHAL